MKTNKVILTIIVTCFIAFNATSVGLDSKGDNKGISTAGTQTKQSQLEMTPKDALQKLKEGSFQSAKTIVELRSFGAGKVEPMWVATLGQFINQRPSGIWQTQQFRRLIKCFAGSIVLALA